MTARRLALTLLALLPAAPALAAEDAALDIAVEVDRSAATSDFSPEHGKAATADASPVPPGTLEVEVGYAPVWNDAWAGAGFRQAGAAATHALNASATFGIAPDVDVRVATLFGAIYQAPQAQPGVPTQGSGVGDVRLGGRWRFLNATGSAVELALVAEAVIPTGTRDSATQLGLSQGFWSGRMGLVGTKDIGRATFNAELACTLPIGGDRQGPSAVVQANVAAGYHLTAWAQPEVELNYQASLGSESQVVAVTAGLVAPWGSGNRVVAAVQHGLWGRNAIETTSVVLAFKTAI